MTPLHVVGQSGDKEMATFLFENGKQATPEGDIVAREPLNVQRCTRVPGAFFAVVL